MKPGLGIGGPGYVAGSWAEPGWAGAGGWAGLAGGAVCAGLSRVV